jgi:hypothetical protein
MVRRICILASALCAGLALETPRAAVAADLAYDGFGVSFPRFADSGFGFSAPWDQGGFNVIASAYLFEKRSLCWGGLRSAEGRISASAFASIHGALRTLHQPLGRDNTIVYVSFLLRPEGVLNAGLFGGFFGLTLNGELGRDLFIGKPGGGAANKLVLESRGGFGQFASAVETRINRTRLIVVKAQFLPGPDVFSLYIDPRPGSDEQAPHAVKADLDLGQVSALGIYSTGAFSIDEIRVSTAFADVTATGKTACEDDDGDDRR